MIQVSVSRRYARALFSLALDDGQHERVGEELEGVAQVIHGSREARTLVENPVYTQAQRHAFVDLLASSFSLSSLMVSFLRLLVDRHRLAQIESIARNYRDLVDEKMGRVRATVTSARPLSDEDLRRVREVLSAVTRRTTVLESRTDPQIVGGLVSQVGPTVWDGSLKTQLERLRRELKSGGV